MRRIQHLPRMAALGAAFLGVLLTGCHANPASSGAAAAEVRSARLAQNAAILARDAEAVARFWTDDVEIRRGFGALVTGKQAVP